LHLLEEMAAVAQVGQRVAGGELVDLLVVVRFYAGVADELEEAFADGNVVAVGEDALRDRRVVEAGGVGRAQVADAVLVAVAPDLAVLARDALVGDAQVGFLRTPDQHARGVDVGASAEPGAVDHDHAGRTRHRAMRAVAEQGALRGFGWAVAVVHVAAGGAGLQCSGNPMAGRGASVTMGGLPTG